MVPLVLSRRCATLSWWKSSHSLGSGSKSAPLHACVDDGWMSVDQGCVDISRRLTKGGVVAPRPRGAREVSTWASDPVIREKVSPQ